MTAADGGRDSGGSDALGLFTDSPDGYVQSVEHPQVRGLDAVSEHQ